MILRFCLYSILKNLRFFEPFFVIYLLSGAHLGGPDLSYLQIGTLIGYQKLLTGLLEIPSGFATDRWGRRRALALTFSCYVVAFPLYASSTGLVGVQQMMALYIAQTFFGLGEALRTGSHKAIMLDWADRSGRSADTTRIIGVTRFFSKASLGVSALGGGLLIYYTGTFRWLFWMSTVPAALGVLLMLSYPTWLEGEMSRAKSEEPLSRRRMRIRDLWASPGILSLMLQSVLFESQVHLAQLYIQPFLKEGLDTHDVAVVGGVGALIIGTYYLVQDLLGGSAAMLAGPLEKRVGDPQRALHLVYVLATLCCAVLAAGLFMGWLALGIAVFFALAVLQNARRPIFISQFNRVMDRPQRTTTLSIESQARTWGIAMLAPLTGYIVDRYGLAWVFVTITAIFVAGLGLAIRPQAHPVDPE